MVQDSCIKKKFMRISNEPRHTSELLLIAYKMKFEPIYYRKKTAEFFLAGEAYRGMGLLRSIDCLNVVTVELSTIFAM